MYYRYYGKQHTMTTLCVANPCRTYKTIISVDKLIKSIARNEPHTHYPNVHVMILHENSDDL